MNTVPAKTAVLVLGAPRSGTSAVAQMLSDLGIDFGASESFVDPIENPHNPMFFELRRLNALNGKMLESSGYDYITFDCLLPPDGMRFSPDQMQAGQQEIAALIEEELGNGALIGLKDPRFSFTLPIWRAALEALGYRVKYLVTTRADEDVVVSNMKVNGWNREHNRRLAWLSVSAAAVHTLHADVLVVDFEQLVADPASEARRVAAWLGIEDAAASASGSLDPKLRHERSGGARLLSGNDGLEQVARQYGELHAELTARGLIELIDKRRAEASDLWRLLSATRDENDLLRTGTGVDDIKRLLDATKSRIDEDLQSVRDWMATQARESTYAASAALSLSARRIEDLESAVFERAEEVRQLKQSLQSAESARDANRDQAEILRASLDNAQAQQDAERAKWQEEKSSINMAYSEETSLLRQTLERADKELAIARMPWYSRLMRKQ